MRRDGVFAFEQNTIETKEGADPTAVMASRRASYITERGGRYTVGDPFRISY